MINMKNITIEKLREIYDEDYRPRNNDAFVMEYLDEFNRLHIRKDVVFEWSDDQIIKHCNEFLTMHIKEAKINEFIDIDKTILPIKIVIENNYLPSYEACQKIVGVIEKAKNIKVLNFNDFAKAGSRKCCWDLVIMYSKLEKDPHTYYNFQCIFLNDNKYINPIPLYYKRFPPYETGKRFTGLLAHLYYSGYQDLYEKMFSNMIEVIKEHFYDIMPLPYFLYTFCYENDTDKLSVVLKIIEDAKNKNPDFDDELRIVDFYNNRFSSSVFELSKIKIKELIK